MQRNSRHIAVVTWLGGSRVAIVSWQSHRGHVTLRWSWQLHCGDCVARQWLQQSHCGRVTLQWSGGMVVVVVVVSCCVAVAVVVLWRWSHIWGVVAAVVVVVATR